MAMIKPGFTTMSQSNPAVFAGKPYRYRGDPRWEPGDKRYRQPRQGEPLPQNVTATSAKQKRIARYCELRLAGKSRAEAAADPGVLVGDSTSKAYEAEYRLQQEQSS